LPVQTPEQSLQGARQNALALRSVSDINTSKLEWTEHSFSAAAYGCLAHLSKWRVNCKAGEGVAHQDGFLPAKDRKKSQPSTIP